MAYSAWVSITSEINRQTSGEYGACNKFDSIEIDRYLMLNAIKKKTKAKVRSCEGESAKLHGRKSDSSIAPSPSHSRLRIFALSLLRIRTFAISPSQLHTLASSPSRRKSKWPHRNTIIAGACTCILFEINLIISLFQIILKCTCIK